jgi:hypothetical protein
MPIGRKEPPIIMPIGLDNVVSEINRVFNELYSDINLINNKLSLYLNMVQDAASGESGNFRLTKKVTSDKGNPKYQLLGKSDEGWVMIQDDLSLLDASEEQDSMEVRSKNLDTEKPIIRT